MNRRVAITGIGWVTPLGQGVDEVWQSLLAGRSGIGLITRFDAASSAVRIAGEARMFAPESCMDRHEIKRLDLYSQFALAAGVAAIQDSGINVPSFDPYRLGVLVGTGAGGITTTARSEDRLTQLGISKVPPMTVPMMMCNASASAISRRFNLRGPSAAIVSACSSGAMAIAQAATILRDDQADVVLAGGSEASIIPVGIGAFMTAGALTKDWNDEPTKASRPFDIRRSGFVMGEGAAILVLEDLDHARARGARIYAELAGYGLTSDAYHVSAPEPTGEPAARAIRQALAMAGEPPEAVGYVNAHGTSTPLNDPAEVAAIRLGLGSAAADRVAVSSSKSMIGHMLGAAGAVEAGITALSLYHGMIHPTINVEQRDPACNVDVVPEGARRTPDLRLALSNSFAFGGHNAVLALRKVGP